MLWLRIDPEFQWLRQLVVEQPDTVWHSMLKYERDAVAQVEVSENVLMCEMCCFVIECMCSCGGVHEVVFMRWCS